MSKRITVTIGDMAYGRLLEVIKYCTFDGKPLTKSIVVDHALTHFLNDDPEGYDWKEATPDEQA